MPFKTDLLEAQLEIESAKIIAELPDGSSVCEAAEQFQALAFERTQQYKHERDTYYLLGQLEKDRMKRAADARGDGDKSNNERDNITAAGVIEREKDTNSSFRQIQFILNWSEEIADVNKRFYTPYTSYQKTSRLIAKSKKISIDPDRVFRSGKLDADDESEEQKFLESLWTLYRAGSYDEMIELCIDCGQHWRAVTLSGDNLFEDENFSSHTTGDRMDTSEDGSAQTDITVFDQEGNDYRNQWRRTCQAMAQDKTLNHHERAIYIMLSGVPGNEIFTLSPEVIRSYEDHLWVHYKMLFNYLKDQALSKSFLGSQEDVSPPESRGTLFTDERQIFEHLRSHRSDGVASIYRIVQESIILGDIDDMFQSIRSHLPNCSPIEITDRELFDMETGMLRFYANLVLFYKPDGFSTVDDMGDPLEEILLFYWMHLYRSISVYNNQNLETITAYTAKLSPESQKQYHAKLFRNIKAEEDRKKAIQIAEMFNLNIQEITKATVDDIYQSWNQDHMDSEDASQMENISSVAWYYHSGQMVAAVEHCCELASRFIDEKNSEAARELFDTYDMTSVDDNESCMIGYHSISKYLKCIQLYQTALGRRMELEMARDEISRTLFHPHYLAGEAQMEIFNKLRRNTIPQLYFYLHHLYSMLGQYQRCLNLLEGLDTHHSPYFTTFELQLMLDKTREVAINIWATSDPHSFSPFLE
ncbi:nucleoporin [Planoprotostelium fungivorum]|uniref:Nuclear pore complex protein n=1 Tax=Planoprotostelium fungivorum TaxID=1890364 RepID=A0A2P6NEX3_9EUKA|nr:nucleoporin [Planoprotostelium fungivorum]